MREQTDCLVPGSLGWGCQLFIGLVWESWLPIRAHRALEPLGCYCFPYPGRKYSKLGCYMPRKAHYLDNPEGALQSLSDNSASFTTLKMNDWMDGWIDEWKDGWIKVN